MGRCKYQYPNQARPSAKIMQSDFTNCGSFRRITAILPKQIWCSLGECIVKPVFLSVAKDLPQTPFDFRSRWVISPASVRSPLAVAAVRDRRYRKQFHHHAALDAQGLAAAV